MNLDVVPLGFNALSAVYGLMPVTLEKVGSSGNDYKLIEFYGKGDATSKYGQLIADNAAEVLTGVTSATYDSVKEVLTLTMDSGTTTATLKSAATLAVKGIYGIEPHLS